MILGFIVGREERGIRTYNLWFPAPNNSCNPLVLPCYLSLSLSLSLFHYPSLSLFLFTSSALCRLIFFLCISLPLSLYFAPSISFPVPGTSAIATDRCATPSSSSKCDLIKITGMQTLQNARLDNQLLMPAALYASRTGPSPHLLFPPSLH